VTIQFEELVECLAQELRYRKGLEEQLRKLKNERDMWREAAEPGWNERELRAALDGEIRLLREQG